jgi:hypothetical protein
MRDIIELKEMAYYDIWRAVSKFAPEDWDVRQYSSHVSMECKGENHRTWYMYAHISKINVGAEIEFACVYNRDEGIVFKKFYTVESFEDLIRYVKKIFKFGPDTIDNIYDEMVKTFKNSFDRLLK